MKAKPGAGWDRRALEAAERTRARLLHDLLTDGTENGPPAAAQTDRWRRLQELRHILGFLGGGLVRSLLHHETLDPRITELLTPPLNELEALRGDDAPARGESLEPPLVAQPPVDLGAVQRELDPGTILLFYYLGPEDGFGWVVSAHHLRGVPLGPAAPIRELAGALHQQLAGLSPPLGASTVAWSARLAEILYSPFAAELGRRRPGWWWWRLRRSPASRSPRCRFGRLAEPADRLRALVNLPSAGVLEVLRRRAARRKPGSRLLAIVDDPVYDDDPRLPAAVRRPGPFRRLFRGLGARRRGLARELVEGESLLNDAAARITCSCCCSTS